MKKASGRFSECICLLNGLTIVPFHDRNIQRCDNPRFIHILYVFYCCSNSWNNPTNCFYSYRAMSWGIYILFSWRSFLRPSIRHLEQTQTSFYLPLHYFQISWFVIRLYSVLRLTGSFFSKTLIFKKGHSTPMEFRCFFKDQ